MLRLNSRELSFYNRFKALKTKAGSHAPSIYALSNEFPDVKADIDACFLCNPYAFELFYSHIKNEDLERYLKFYPPQNSEIAGNIALYNHLPAENILIGNGAIEIIESLFKHFYDKKILIPIPTFSSYYEAAEKRNEVVYFQLHKEKQFSLDKNEFMAFIRGENPDVVILVNPNNPTGLLIQREEVIELHQSLRKDQVLIVDESFIHFHEADNSIEQYAVNYDNIIIIRSLSKDFGVAGVRIGYAVLSVQLKSELTHSGYLWNSNGLAYLFSIFLTRTAFQSGYQLARANYNRAKATFESGLLALPGLKVYQSHTNFFLIELSYDPYILFTKLFIQFGIYTRVMDDRIGLKGNFIRIASKNHAENSRILYALENIR